MSEMFERIIAAIENSASAPLCRGEYERLAQITLKILREPTEAMIDAGYSQCSGDSRRSDVEDAWRAMIDAAIAA